MRRFFLVLILIFIIFYFIEAKREGENPFNLNLAFFCFYAIMLSLGEFKKKVIAQGESLGRQKLIAKPFRNEYVPRFLSLYLIFSILLIFLAVIVAAASIGFFIFFFILAGLVMIAFAIPPKLILSDDGIEVQTLMKKMEHKWEDIVEIARYYDGTEVIIMQEKNQRISLNAYQPAWRTHEIGRIIQENAPFLEFLE